MKSMMDIGIHQDAIIPNSNNQAALSSYPTRIAMPIVPAAYQSIQPDYWQKHENNP